ncbi:MAG: ychM [Labilithrix sp.]|nr:ychM [Labilithrix sp.]
MSVDPKRQSYESTPGEDVVPKGPQPFPIATAIRRAFAKGYGLGDLRADAMAGAVVAVVALPLSMALAIAVGAPPQHGLYTAIVAGIVVALLGGCKFQVTGPTAASIVILAPIVNRHGLTGLMTAGVMAGLILIALGAVRAGSLIRFIPYPVTTGFTAGIATVIATLQIKDIFGLATGPLPDHYMEKLSALWEARTTASVAELGVAATTLALLVYTPRVIKKVPAPLIAISFVAALCAVVHRFAPGFEIATIGTRFHTTVGGVDVAGIPGGVPTPALPWGSGLPSFHLLTELMGPAFAIAMLAAIESLLSAVIADGMTNTKHDPNAELVALGIGNVVAPFFGGIAATGALARTATNVRAGARSPLASVTHAVLVLLSILLLAPLVSYVPMASLAALLLLVAWNMSEVRHFAHLVRVAPRSDVLVLVSCFLLTVFFDMVVAVSVGFMMAAVLFMKRMSDLTETRLTLDASEDAPIKAPKGVLVYEINGPLFFGASQNAMSTLGAVRGDSFRVLILHLGRVPVIDATGFVALENAIDSVIRQKKHVVLAGPLPRPRTIFDKARLETTHPELRMAESLDAALVIAASLVDASPPSRTTSMSPPPTPSTRSAA